MYIEVPSEGIVNLVWFHDEFRNKKEEKALGLTQDCFCLEVISSNSDGIA